MLCAAVDEMDAAVDGLDVVDGGSATEVEAAFVRITQAAQGVAATAPDAVRDESADLVEGFERFASILEDAGWDPAAADGEAVAPVIEEFAAASDAVEDHADEVC